MYNRSYGQRRPPRIPQNYSGNAFSPSGSVQIPQSHPQPPTPSPPPEPDEIRCNDTCERSPSPQGGMFALPPAPSPLPPEDDCGGCEGAVRESCECREEPKPKPHALFPNGIGDEEMLILGLILLLSQGGGECDAGEVIPFLVLLLFC